MKANVKNENEFITEARNFARALKPGTVILMNGNLGAGKTLWVRSVVEELGGKWVSSPSFAVIQRYPTEAGAIDHVDLYRLKDDADIESTGFWDLFHDPKAIVFVEWAERVPENQWPISFKISKVKIDIPENEPLSRTIQIL